MFNVWEDWNTVVQSYVKSARYGRRWHQGERYDIRKVLSKLSLKKKLTRRKDIKKKKKVIISKRLVMWRQLSLAVVWDPGLKAGGEADDRGWDGWMLSPIQRTRVWANSRRQWRTGNQVCCSPWDHRVRHNWVTEQQQ